MKKYTLFLFTVLAVSACGGDKKPDLTVNPATAIWINSDIAYDKTAKIDQTILSECGLPAKLSYFVKIHSDEAGVGVLQVGSNKKKANRLELLILDAVSGGNAFIGHRKYSKVKGSLYKNGKKVGEFTAARMSGGGMFAGFKGSCSVLGRTVDAIGEDIAGWLKKPINGQHMGDSI